MGVLASRRSRNISRMFPMNHRLSRLPILALSAFLSAVAPAADWPAWRYDAGHSGASPENLTS